MAKRNTYDNPTGKLIMVSMRLKDFALNFFENKSQEKNSSRIDMITEALCDGEFYDSNLAAPTASFFADNPEIATEYYGAGREHDPVTENVIPDDNAAIRHFIKEAVSEKIAREGA